MHQFAVLLIVVCALSFSCRVQAANVVTPINHFAVVGGSGDYTKSQELCTENGGFLPAEMNAAYHDHLFSKAQDAGGGNQWYAYLGGSTVVPDGAAASLDTCSPDVLHQGTGSRTCYWRWNQGRWLYLQETRPDINNIPNTGVVFFIGNNIYLKEQAGSVNGFANYFNASSLTDFDPEARPGNLFGQYLILVGNSKSSRWSDNWKSGGYAYSGYSWQNMIKFDPDKASTEATKVLFITLCEVQPMHRETYELFNTSSHIEENWWAVFFAIFFVIALVGFIVTAACQEREDMDEPPEDAPEWAEKHQKAQQTRRFVSMRSFRQYDDDRKASAPREDDSNVQVIDNNSIPGWTPYRRDGNNQNPFVANQSYEEQVSHHSSMRDN